MIALCAVVALLVRGPPGCALLAAARAGDANEIDRICNANPELDTNMALCTAAAFNRIGAMERLEGAGAADTNAAMIQASIRDHPQALRWLMDSSRVHAATNLAEAARFASATNSVQAEWTLCSEIRKREFAGPT